MGIGGRHHPKSPKHNNHETWIIVLEEVITAVLIGMMYWTKGEIISLPSLSYYHLI